MRRKRNHHLLFALFGLIGLFGLLTQEFLRLPDGSLRVHFLDVGQGDSALLISPSGKQIVIDGGPDLTALERIGDRMPFFDRTIDLLVLTHPDADHLTSIPELAERYQIGGVLMAGIEPYSAQYRRLLSNLVMKHTPVVFADPGRDIDFGDGLIFDVLWPPAKTLGTTPKKPNNTSLVLRALYKEHRILFTGDIEASAEAAILRSGTDLRSDILKVAHHGSKTSSGTGFLLAANPKKAVISVHAGNSYGHPHASTLQRLLGMGIEILRTDREGTISLALR